MVVVVEEGGRVVAEPILTRPWVVASLMMPSKVDIKLAFYTRGDRQPYHMNMLNVHQILPPEKSETDFTGVLREENFGQCFESPPIPGEHNDMVMTSTEAISKLFIPLPSAATYMVLGPLPLLPTSVHLPPPPPPLPTLPMSTVIP